MKKIIHSILLFSALIAPVYHAHAQTNPTAPALGFNVFCAQSCRLHNNETEGPVALGGDLLVDGGYQVSTNYPGTFMVGGVHVTLVVGGKVVYMSGSLQVNQSGYVKIGNCIGSTMWYTDPGGAFPPIRITPGSDYNGSPRINLQVSSSALGVSASVNPICQSGVIDFVSAFTQMKSYATTMGAMTDNAVITNSGGTVIPHTGLPSQIKITLNSGLNIFNVSGADLNNLTDFIYNNSPDADHKLLINVNAPGSFIWHVCNSGGIGFSQCPYIMYNFYNATSINIASGGAVEGTVFAPYAEITKTTNSSNIEGQVIAQSYYHGGGENHYAVFLPSIPGLGATLPPAASYTVNSNNQCLSCNSFVFNNTSTGTAPLTYTWTFGDGTTSTVANPTHVYTATGSYGVKLRVSGPGGTDSVTHTEVVSGNPASGFTINDSVQDLSGNNFVFTSATPTFGNIYNWDFGDGTHFTAINPSKVYTVAGTYTVTQTVTGSGGCVISVPAIVVVESDGVGGGGGGGLESVSLGDLVSRREIRKIRDGINSKTDYSTTPVFVKLADNVYAKGTVNTSILQKLTPATLDATTTPMITTPTDLTSITTAVDVFSVDYTKNNIAKAVVLAITTKDKAYNHTKSICDRFRGATLINTQFITIQGFKFIQFALKKTGGDVEYCVAFAAGKSAGSSNIRLQSKWLISEYTGDDSVFNFQVWATIPANAQKLAGDILTSLAAIMPLQQTDVDFMLPPAYITYGKRNKEFLEIGIASNTSSNNAKVVFIEKINEVANTDSLIIPFNITAGSDNTFSIPIKDGYEYEGHFFLNDTLTDDVYIADGNWSLDYDGKYTNITNYKPNNNFNRVYVDGEYPLYRSVQVNASTSDYISIYKFITAGQEKVDLTDYHSFKFIAKGKGNAEIRLIRDSVIKFNDQYKMVVALDTAGKSYQVSFDDFTSDNLTAPFNPNDVKAVVYTFRMNGVPTDFSFFADEQSFSPTVVTSIKALTSKKVSLFPNPTTGQFQCTFASEEDRDMDITLTDITGNQVYKQSIHAVTGMNTFTVNIPRWIAQSLLMVQVGNKQVKYGVTKLTILR